MTLRKYLEDNGIDQIKEDQTFMEAEYHAVHEYCENCGYLMTDEDLEVIRGRGLEESFINWKTAYSEDLWEEFGKVPVDPHTEETEEPWKHFPQGTHREEIWHWFEERFDLSAAEDLMQTGGRRKLYQSRKHPEKQKRLL